MTIALAEDGDDLRRRLARHLHHTQALRLRFARIARSRGRSSLRRRRQRLRVGWARPRLDGHPDWSLVGSACTPRLDAPPCLVEEEAEYHEGEDGCGAHHETRARAVSKGALNGAGGGWLDGFSFSGRLRADGYRGRRRGCCGGGDDARDVGILRLRRRREIERLAREGDDVNVDGEGDGRVLRASGDCRREGPEL